jgi:hypothetical protein
MLLWIRLFRPLSSELMTAKARIRFAPSPATESTGS